MSRPLPRHRIRRSKWRHYKTANERHAEQTKETVMEEILARFGPAAIEELSLRRPQREPKNNFVLLMAGLFILILLLYALIIWSQHPASFASP
jgi:hypothetical protein